MLPAEAPKPSPHTVTVTPLPLLTEKPAWIDCPYCNHCTKTLVTAEGGSAQWFVLLSIICRKSPVDVLITSLFFLFT